MHPEKKLKNSGMSEEDKSRNHPVILLSYSVCTTNTWKRLGLFGLWIAFLYICRRETLHGTFSSCLLHFSPLILSSSFTHFSMFLIHTPSSNGPHKIIWRYISLFLCVWVSWFSFIVFLVSILGGTVIEFFIFCFWFQVDRKPHFWILQLQKSKGECFTSFVDCKPLEMQEGCYSIFFLFFSKENSSFFFFFGLYLLLQPIMLGYF